MAVLYTVNTQYRTHTVSLSHTQYRTHTISHTHKHVINKSNGPNTDQYIRNLNINRSRIMMAIFFVINVLHTVCIHFSIRLPYSSILRLIYEEEIRYGSCCIET